jgi:hypothetical protein
MGDLAPDREKVKDYISVLARPIFLLSDFQIFT